MTEKNCDILVVGSGLTGIVAAYALSLLGLKIIIIENSLDNKLKSNFSYLKLKSANIEKKSSNYVFWYETDTKSLEELLKTISKLSDEDVSISIYSKSGAFE